MIGTKLCYKHVMKIHYIIFTAFFLAFTLFPSFSIAQKMGIAAVVNDDIITYSDVEGRVQLGLRATNLRDTQEAREKLTSQALNSLIEEQLRLQEAKRLNINIAEADIESAVDNIANQNNVSPEKFRAVLNEKYSTLNSLKRQVKAQLAWTQVVRQRLRPQVNVTEADIDGFINDLNKHEGKSEYNIAEILLLTQDEKQSQENKTLAQDLVKQLRAGASFPGIARQFSQGKEARNGGAIGWILEDLLDPQLSETIKSLTPGAISDPIKTDYGYHILLLRGKRTVNTQAISVSELHLKQALLPLSETDSQEVISQAQAKAAMLKNEIKDCNAMDQLIADQNNQMSRDIGTINESQIPPALAPQIKDLPVNTLSDPIQAAEGLLLIMVCDRKESSSDNQLRDQIANKIGAERLERLQQRYVRDLKATAYIDIKN